MEVRGWYPRPGIEFYTYLLHIWVVTGMAGTNLTSRAILYDAVAELKRSGYTSIRVAGSSRLFDLIAWNREEFLFIAVRRTRNSGISKYSHHVSQLSSLIREAILPGRVQFWIYAVKEWHRYQILPGGALLLRGGFQ
ncbi:MAG TPA: hypothetical protein VN429_10715 [Methanospirillum sp.]|uniref:hypothetical protein n=1 Tax=Methanospirillum sp. TaxID=45200 RepID=UPI002C786222|nr:hypothetical protein [Methanospirillum sp.]HWQ64878.1 hypothetical protein [Methanospirillum sp.]